jgi:rubrerythrin
MKGDGKFMYEKEMMAIKTAIINEVEGYEFYKMAADKAVDEETKNAFLELADQEKMHIDWLNDFKCSMDEGNACDFNLDKLEAAPSPKIFKWENLDRKSAGIAVSVYGIGMQMEKASVEFYKGHAEKTEVKEMKKLFNVLAEWERTHYEQFAAQYEMLKDNWWSEQNYAPF